MWATSLCERLSEASPLLLTALLDTAMKGTAILLLTALVACAMRRASAAARHLVWFLGTLSLLILPILSAVLPGWYVLPRWANHDVPPSQQAALPPIASTPVVPPSAEAAPPLANPTQPRLEAMSPARATAASGPSAPVTPAPTRPSLPMPSPARLTWQPWVVLGWLAGSVFYLAYVMLACFSLRRLQRRSPRITQGSWTILLRELCGQLRFRRPVELLSSGRRTMPMTWGLWRTWLLLPVDAADWAPEQRRAVLLHELAHAKRWDCLTQFLAQIACSLHWFNPLIWLARRRMQAERELACDDLVLIAGTKASVYAEQLLHIAREMPAVRFSTAAIAMARPSKLEGRLRAILDTGRNRRLAVSTIVLASLAIGISALALATLRAGDTPGSSLSVAAPSLASATSQAAVPLIVPAPMWTFDVPDRASDVQFTPDSRCLVVADMSGTVYLVDALTGKEVRHFTFTNDIYRAGCTPDGREVFAAAIASEQDGTHGFNAAVVKVWNTQTGELLRTCDTKVPARNLAVSRDGRLLAFSVVDDTFVRIWDVAGCKEIRRIDASMIFEFSPDGKYLVAKNVVDKKFHIWELATGKDLGKFNTLREPWVGTFSPDGDRILMTDGKREAQMFDVQSRREMLTIQADMLTEDHFPTVLVYFAFAPDGKSAVCGGRGLTLWDLQTGQRKARFPIDGYVGMGFAVSPDGRFATAGGPGKVRLWQLPDFGAARPEPATTQAATHEALSQTRRGLRERGEYFGHISDDPAAPPRSSAPASGATDGAPATTQTSNPPARQDLSPLGQPTAVLPAAVLPQAVTIPASARGIADAITAGLREQHHRFLTEARLEQIARQVERRVTEWDISSVASDRVTFIRNAIARYVPIYFPAGEPETVYLEFDDRLSTLQWRIWRALHPKPIDAAQVAEQERQRQWLIDFIYAAPESPRALRARSLAPGDMRALAVVALVARYADPLGFLLVEPIPDEAFTRLQAQLKKDYANPNLWLDGVAADAETFGFFAAVPYHTTAGKSAITIDLALPFDDTAVGMVRRNECMLLSFASHARATGRSIDLTSEGRQPRDLADFATYRQVRLPRGVALADVRAESREAGYAGKDCGDIALDPGGQFLLALPGVRIAPLPGVHDWFAADALSDDQVAAALREHGSDRASIAGAPTAPAADTHAPFFAVRTIKGDLGVIRLSYLNGSPGPGGDASGTVYLRLRDPNTPHD